MSISTVASRPVPALPAQCPVKKLELAPELEQTQQVPFVARLQAALQVPFAARLQAA